MAKSAALGGNVDLILLQGADPCGDEQGVTKCLRDRRPNLMIMSGKIVQLVRGQNVVGQDGGREVCCGEQRGDGDERG